MLLSMPVVDCSQKDPEVELIAVNKASVIADCSVKQDDKDFASLKKKDAHKRFRKSDPEIGRAHV